MLSTNWHGHYLLTFKNKNQKIISGKSYRMDDDILLSEHGPFIWFETSLRRLPGVLKIYYWQYN